MAVAAQVRFPIPGTDVPMTLQPLALLLIGMTFPASLSAAAMLLYLCLGGLGLPVFAGDGGLTGATGGYLVGFLAAAPLIGWVARKNRRSFIRLFAAGAFGMAVVLVCGVLWRILWFHGGISWAVMTGALPFLTKACVESALAAAIVRQGSVRWCRKNGV